jgi:hypothetical protein
MSKWAELYKQETGEDAITVVADGAHCVGIKVFSGHYVMWLEARAAKAAESAPTSTNNRSTKFPRNCCSCPVELDDRDGCTLRFYSARCRQAVARERRAVR